MLRPANLFGSGSHAAGHKAANPHCRGYPVRDSRAGHLRNLRQLTLAWIAYAEEPEEHDGKIIRGFAYDSRTGEKFQEGWAGRAFLHYGHSRAELTAHPEKAPLWPWMKDVDIYRCPGGRAGHLLTYAAVAAANGGRVERTYLPNTRPAPELPLGRRVGSTVLRLTNRTEIVSPGAAQRVVAVPPG